MTKVNIEDTLRESALNVLETMFFAEPEPAEDDAAAHCDPVTCLLHCSGAADGAFSIAVDRSVLAALCCSFYGEDEPVATQQQELICELTNMLAGSSLSVLAPSHYCELSSPQLCSFDRHVEVGTKTVRNAQSTLIMLAVEGGLLSISCMLRDAE
jgi:CheY-specific phosphatase CheX